MKLNPLIFLLLSFFLSPNFSLLSKKLKSGLTPSPNYDFRSFFSHKIQFNLASETFFELFSTFPQNDISSIKKEIFEVTQPPNFKIMAFTGFFSNLTFIPVISEIFLENHFLSYDLKPKTHDEFEYLMMNAEKIKWEKLNNLNEIQTDFTFFKEIMIEGTNETNFKKIKEIQEVKNVKKKTEKLYSRLLNEKKQEYEYLKALILIKEGDGFGKLKDFKKKIEKDLKEEILNKEKEMNDLKTLKLLLEKGKNMTKVEENIIKMNYRERLEENLKIMKENALEINQITTNNSSLREEMTLRIKENERILNKSIEMEDIKSFFLNTLNQKYNEYREQRIIDGKKELEYAKNLTNEEFEIKVEKFKEFIEKNQRFSNDSEIIKYINETLNENLEPFMAKNGNLSQKTFNYSELYELIIIPMKKNIENEFIYELQADKLKLEEFRFMKGFLENSTTNQTEIEEKFRRIVIIRNNELNLKLFELQMLKNDIIKDFKYDFYKRKSQEIQAKLNSTLNETLLISEFLNNFRMKMEKTKSGENRREIKFF